MVVTAGPEARVAKLGAAGPEGLEQTETPERGVAMAVEVATAVQAETERRASADPHLGLSVRTPLLRQMTNYQFKLEKEACRLGGTTWRRRHSPRAVIHCKAGLRPRRKGA